MIYSVDTDEAPSGGDVNIQTFYEGHPTCQCCKNWVEKEPAEIPPEAKTKYFGAAILIYKIKDHSSVTLGSLKKYKVQSIVIQSPIIRKEISPILAQAGYISSEANIRINEPFQEIFFSRARLQSL